VQQKIFVLTGSCASGKTTLVDHYRTRNDLSIAIVEEAARKFFAKNLVLKEERASLVIQKAIQDFYFEQYSAACNLDVSAIIGDDSPLGAVAYATLADPQAGNILLRRIPQEWLQKITCFLLLDISDIPYELDPTDTVRRETPQERERVQEIFISLLKRLEIPHTIVRGNVERRIAQIDALMKQ